MELNRTSHRTLTWLPRWLLRLIGISSIAAALLTLVIYWYKTFPKNQRRRLNGSRKDKIASDTSGTESQSSSSWSARVLSSVTAGSLKPKKRLTVSLKNTILWNPSQDVDVPNHAFQENGATLLSRLAKFYDVHIIVHVNSDDEQYQVRTLLENAGIVGSSGIQEHKILYCSSEQGKIHLVRHIEPYLHIEGGWEKDDGEDIVRSLRQFVPKLVWVITKRRRSSFNEARLKDSDQGILGNNVELAEKVLDTSLAQEMGFLADTDL